MSAQASVSAPVRRPFERLRIESPSFIRRVLNRYPRQNAWVEVNNLLADAESVRDVRPEQVARIADRYRIPMRGEFVARLERLYRDYLVFCLADARLTDEEQADLAHLKRILRLNDRAVHAIHETVSQQIYAQSVDAMLADGRIDPAEREFLNALQLHLAISGFVVDRILENRRRRATDVVERT
jgi:hypothetical protein